MDSRPIGQRTGKAQGGEEPPSIGLLHALAEDFREHGLEAIRIMRIERPAEYVKVVASLMPNELLHSGSNGERVQFARVEHVIVQVEHQPRLIEHEPGNSQIIDNSKA
jgi:hypothetical protein